MDIYYEMQQRKSRIEALNTENAALLRKIATLEDADNKAAEKSRQLEGLRNDLESIAGHVRNHKDTSSILMGFTEEIHSIICGNTANQSEQDLLSVRGEARTQIECAEYQISQNKVTISKLEEEIRQLQVESAEVQS